jgi:hypothetical protein
VVQLANHVAMVPSVLDQVVDLSILAGSEVIVISINFLETVSLSLINISLYEFVSVNNNKHTILLSEMQGCFMNRHIP